MNETSHNPALTFTWRFHNADVVNDQNKTTFENGTLFFREVRRSDLGQYTCIVNISEGTMQRSAWLREAYANASSVSIDPPDQLALIGGVAVLECKVDARPAPIIMWIKDSNAVEETDKNNITELAMGHSMLQIINITYADAGSFTCNVSHISSTYAFTSPTAIVRVNGPPTIILKPQPQSVPIGFNVTFMCQVVSEPRSQVTWTFQQNIFSGSLNLSASQQRVSVDALNGSLFLMNVNETDSGVYTCTWSNRYGSASAQVTLQVQGQPEPPVILAISFNTSLEEGETLMLKCSGDGNPMPSVQWLHPNGASLNQNLTINGVIEETDDLSRAQLQRRTTVDVDGNLTLRNVSRDDIGFYTCKLVNPLAEIESHVFVDVLFKPYFRVPPQRITVNESVAFALSCEYNGNPNPTVTWSVPFNPNLHISASNSSLSSGNNEFVLGNGTLLVFRASVIHNGVYTCQVSNLVGFATASVTVTVAGLPSFTTTPVSQVVAEGGSVVFYCQVESLSSTTVVWYTKYMDDSHIQASNIEQLKTSIFNRAGLPVQNMTLIQQLQDNHYKFVNGTSLEITNVTKLQAGIYICMATNDIGYVFESAILQVTTFPLCLMRNINISVSHNISYPSIIKINSVTSTSTSIALHMSSIFSIPALVANKVILQYKQVSSAVWQTQTLFFSVDQNDYSETNDSLEINATSLFCEDEVLIANQPIKNTTLGSSKPAEVTVKSVGGEYEYSITAVLENLKPNTRYDIKAALSNILGPGPFSLPIQAMTLPAAPTSVTEPIVNVKNRTAIVSWTNPDPLNGRGENINISIVLLDSDSKPVQEVTVSMMDPSTASFPNLKLGRYTIEIYASNTETNTTGKSTFISFQIEDQPPQYVPLMEEIKAIDAHTLLVNWSPPLKPDELIPEVTGYVISVTQINGEQTEEVFEINNATISTFTINERQEYTKYSIRIANKNSMGTGPYSTAKTVMTPYSEFSELALKDTESDDSISWRQLGVILIVICAAFILVTAIVVLIYQLRLARSMTVVVTPPTNSSFDEHTNDNMTSAEKDNQRNATLQNERYQSRTIEGRGNEAFIFY